MAAEIPNIAKGRIAEFQHRVNDNDPANSAFVIVLLRAAESNATLRDYDDLGTLLAAAGNTEADFTDGVTPYARKVITDVDVAAPTVDDTNDRVDLDMPNQTWSDAGGVANNPIVKALNNFDPDTTGGTDADIIPCGIYDTDITTNGSDLILEFAAAGWARAT